MTKALFSFFLSFSLQPRALHSLSLFPLTFQVVLYVRSLLLILSPDLAQFSRRTELSQAGCEQTELARRKKNTWRKNERFFSFVIPRKLKSCLIARDRRPTTIIPQTKYIVCFEHCSLGQGESLDTATTHRSCVEFDL